MPHPCGPYTPDLLILVRKCQPTRTTCHLVWLKSWDCYCHCIRILWSIGNNIDTSVHRVLRVDLNNKVIPISSHLRNRCLQTRSNVQGKCERNTSLCLVLEGTNCEGMCSSCCEFRKASTVWNQKLQVMAQVDWNKLDSAQRPGRQLVKAELEPWTLQARLTQLLVLSWYLCVIPRTGLVYLICSRTECKTAYPRD